MARHHKDKHGVYDLDEVHAITPLITKNREGEVISNKALLHFKSGSALHTDTDYGKAVKLWKGEPIELEKPKPPTTDQDDE